MVLKRLLKPELAATYLDPNWTSEAGERVLREPASGDTMASQVFFVLHRHRFGRYVSAVMEGVPDEPRLSLRDERGQTLELRGLLGGYRGQAPRGAVWVLRVAGVDDHPDLLAGLLEQWSGPPPTEIITDSGSYTDQMFGAFWLLGYRFSARLADVGWRHHSRRAFA